MAGAWIAHIKSTRSKMGSGTSYSAAMKQASKTWKKGGSGAAKKKGKGKKKKK